MVLRAFLIIHAFTITLTAIYIIILYWTTHKIHINETHSPRNHLMFHRSESKIQLLQRRRRTRRASTKGGGGGRK